MEEQILGLDDYLAILKRRKWHLIVPTVLLSVGAVGAALFLPPVYSSKAVVLIEQQEIPGDLVRTTVTSFADQRIQVISQRVMTTANLKGIIERHNLYPDTAKREGMNAAATRLKSDVSLDMISAEVVDPRSGTAKEATIAFSLAYRSEFPNLALRVTNDIVSLFLEENLKQRQAVVEEAFVFLEQESDRLGAHIGSLESSLAAFKGRHRDNLPEQMVVNRELMARTEERIRETAQRIQSLEDQKAYLESELASLDTTITSQGGGQVVGPAARLQRLESDHAGIAARYSPSHPDRVHIEREIAALRKQVQASSVAALRARLEDLKEELAEVRERYSEDHPDVKLALRNVEELKAQLADASTSAGPDDAPLNGSTNPVYTQLKARLDAADLEIRALKEAREELKRMLMTYEERLKEAPSVEREYRALTRDYDTAIQKYQEVKAKQMEAELAKSLETKRKGERFTLIEPPIEPREPDEPNRQAILFVGIMLAFGGGIANLAVWELMDQSVRGPRAVQAVTGSPVLSVIPYIRTKADGLRRRRRALIASGAFFATLFFALVAFHNFVMPLDLFWFKVMRRVTNVLESVMAWGQPGGSWWIL